MKSKFFWTSKVFVAALFVLFSICLFSDSVPAQKFVFSDVKQTVLETRTDNFDSDEQEIFGLVNDERIKRHLSKLAWDSNLSLLARTYSEKMAQDDFFEHTDKRGWTLVDRTKELRIKNWSKIGENLFFCQGYDNFSSFAVRSWMKSSTHRQNILDKDWTTAGIGIAQANDEKIYITQIFIKK